MKNRKGFTLVEVVVSWVIITIIILNASVFFLFAWKLKVQFEDDRAVLGILTSYIEAKKAATIGTAVNRANSRQFGFDFASKGEFESWKTYCIDLWEYRNTEKKKLYPPLIYPLPTTASANFIDNKPNKKETDKYVEINYQWCKIEISRQGLGYGSDCSPKYFLMPSMYVWCKSPRSGKIIGVQVTNAFPWRNYNNGSVENF